MVSDQKGSVVLGWSYLGFDTVILENDRLRVVVVPETGAKILQFVDKSLDRDLLYHHPRVELRAPTFGVNVDNWWAGGIDDLIPTGHPCTVNDEELPFHGEVWSMPWTVDEISHDTVSLSRQGVITPLKLRKTLTLRPGARCMSVDYELSNVGHSSFPYLWGIHPAVPIGPATRVHVPARHAWHGDGSPPAGVSSGYLSGTEPEDWPIQGVAELPAEPSGTWSYLYLSELEAGWLAVSDAVEGWGFGVTFPLATFPSVHAWIVDGGWRGLRCAVVEPWSGRPARLDEAIEQGQARTLEPGQVVRADIRFIAFDAATTLSGFDDQGAPI